MNDHGGDRRSGTKRGPYRMSPDRPDSFYESEADRRIGRVKLSDTLDKREPGRARIRFRSRPVILGDRIG